MEQLGANLRDIRRLNAWFGGTQLAVKAVQRVLTGRHSARILDVATGSADIPRALYRWGASQGIQLEIVGADLSPEVLREARRYVAGSEIRLTRADARSLPWKDNSFDVVCCCLALHHFSAVEAVRVLQEMWRVASDAIVVTDLERGYPGYVGAWLATRTIARNTLTRHDGPLSVLRAFTPAEMNDLAEQAGLSVRSVESHAWFRQVLTAVKGGANCD